MTSQNFVLVHGSWHGGWCWRRVASIIRREGHEVWTPTLAGCAERFTAEAGSISLEFQAREVSDLLFFEDVQDAIVVAHSFAGLVLQSLCQSPQERISRFIYLDAYLIPPQKSAWDIWPEEQRRNAEGEIARGYPFRDPVPPEMLGVDDPPTAQWLADRMRPHPLNTYRTPITSEHTANAQLPHHYVHLTKGPTAAMFAGFATAAESRGWRMHEYELPHDAMLTNPKELAEILLRVAAE